MQDGQHPVAKTDGMEKCSTGLQRSPTNKILARSRHQEQLAPWLKACLSRGISDPHTFAEGLQHEYSAIKVVLTQSVKISHGLGDHCNTSILSSKQLSPIQTVVLDKLAHLYLSQSRYAEADPLFLRSFVLNEQVFGPDSASTAKGNEAHI